MDKTTFKRKENEKLRDSVLSDIKAGKSDFSNKVIKFNGSIEISIHNSSKNHILVYKVDTPRIQILHDGNSKILRIMQVKQLINHYDVFKWLFSKEELKELNELTDSSDTLKWDITLNNEKATCSLVFHQN